IRFILQAKDGRQRSSTPGGGPLTAPAQGPKCASHIPDMLVLFPSDSANGQGFSMATDDLFGDTAAPAVAPRRKAGTPPAASVAHSATYSAADIEVLEGLEPVRRRPGMYIGGTDANALHHLFAEVIDNSMDEAIAG